MTDLKGRLRDFSQAYPETMFRPVSAQEREWMHEQYPGLQDRIAGDMGRHFAKFATEAAARIDQLESALLEMRGYLNACCETAVDGIDAALNETAMRPDCAQIKMSAEGHPANIDVGEG